eukprot:478982-Pleurochrysis_carterae.AAC.1
MATARGLRFVLWNIEKTYGIKHWGSGLHPRKRRLLPYLTLPYWCESSGHGTRAIIDGVRHRHSRLLSMMGCITLTEYSQTRLRARDSLRARLSEYRSRSWRPPII